MSDPFVVTLAFDEAAQDYFERQRQEYFPPELNRVPAHLSLFHQLPGEKGEAIGGILQRICQIQQPFEVRVSGLMKLGTGVAYRCESRELLTLHRELAVIWANLLTAQDRQRLRPHVVVQNKAAPDQVRIAYKRLLNEFEPFAVQGVGILLWRYRGGPWDKVALFPFAAKGFHS